MFHIDSSFLECDRVIHINDSHTGLEAYIAVHKLLHNTPSFGATRYASYATSNLALADAMHLSKLMTYKSVMADLPYGGAKAVIRAKHPKQKTSVLLAYASFVDQLQKEFVTGADIGVSQADVMLMKTVAPNNMVGTHIDPVAFTVQGLMLALDETTRIHFDKPSIEGLSFAIQGLGKIGSALLELIYPLADKVYVSDIDTKLIQILQKRYPKVVVVEPNQLYAVEVDFFSPCATSHSLNKNTVKKLNCKVVLGGANIQLAEKEIGIVLHKRKILYVPDYVVNAGGLISVTDEYEHKHNSKQRITQKLNIIPRRVRAILEKSSATNTATSVVADQMADEIIRAYTAEGGKKK